MKKKGKEKKSKIMLDRKKMEKIVMQQFKEKAKRCVKEFSDDMLFELVNGGATL